MGYPSMMSLGTLISGLRVLLKEFQKERFCGPQDSHSRVIPIQPLGQREEESPYQVGPTFSQIKAKHHSATNRKIRKPLNGASNTLTADRSIQGESKLEVRSTGHSSDVIVYRFVGDAIITATPGELTAPY